jgi:alanine dehydrogenase
VKLANLGWKEACKEDAGLANGLNIVEGKVTFKGVADAWNLPYFPC